MKKRTAWTLGSLARSVGGRVSAGADLRIKGIAPLDTAREGDLTFVTNPKYAKAASGTKASALLCDREIPGVDKPFLLCANPYAALARIIGLFHPPAPVRKGVRAGARIERGAKVHSTAGVMPGAFVSKGARVGARTLLYPGVFIGEGASIGKDCLLYPNAVVREGCVLGDRVILHACAVIGADGFGFAKEGKRYLKIPQVGNVVLEDDVEVGACTCVDRAALGTTRIGRGTKLDNLIQIAHNVVIGEDGVVASQTGIAGSTTVGDRVTMGGQVGLTGHIQIGDDVTLASQTGVMEDLAGPQVYWGAPSQSMHDEMKCVAAYRDLPGMLKRLRRLEKGKVPPSPEGEG